uniref:Uncharacterized protein n=1 Tax=Eutreptiella gymnastica TaxID=73025 RepID=A0A7S1I3L9_9EUGL
MRTGHAQGRPSLIPQKSAGKMYQGLERAVRRAKDRLQGPAVLSVHAVHTRGYMGNSSESRPQAWSPVLSPMVRQGGTMVDSAHLSWNLASHRATTSHVHGRRVRPSSLYDCRRFMDNMR